MVSSSPVKSSKLDFKNFFQSKQDKTTGSKTFAASTFSKSLKVKENFADQLRKIADAVPERKEDIVGGSIRVNDQLKEINQNLLSINSAIKDITDILVKERSQDVKNLKDKRLKYKRLAGKREAEKKENVLEGTGKGIVNALKKPFSAINNALGNPLDKIKNALLLLGIGWLTDKFIKLFQSDRDGEKERFDELIGEITKGLLAMGGIALALGGGLTALIGTIGGLALKIGAWVITRPFVWLYKLGKFVYDKLTKPKLPKAPAAKPGTRAKPGISPRLKPGGTTSDGNVRGSRSKTLSGRSTFQLEQARNQATRSASTAPAGPKGPLDRLNRFFRGQLARFETTNVGRGLGKAISWMKGSWIGKLTGGLFNKALGAFEFVKNNLSPKGMGQFGKDVGKFLKRLGPAVTTILSIGSIMNRAQSGMTPAQAILPELIRIALSAGGATLLGGLGSGILSVPLAIAGSFAGDWLGGQLMNWADAPEQSGIWQSSIFNGFNDTVRGLSEGNEVLGNIFPYDTGKQTASAPTMMPDTNFFNVQTNPATANSSATPQVEQSQVETQLDSRSETNIADAVTPSGPGASRQRAETVSQSGFAEGQKVTVDVAQVTAAGQKETSNNGQTASAPPALSASDLSNPYRLLSRSIYNVVIA